MKQERETVDNDMGNSLTGVRVKAATKKKLDEILQMANRKKMGRKVLPDDVLSLALDLVSQDHIGRLQSESLRPSDKKTILYLKYKEDHPQAGREDFEEFTMTGEWPRFLKRYEKEVTQAALVAAN